MYTRKELLLMPRGQGAAAKNHRSDYIPGHIYIGNFVGGSKEGYGKMFIEGNMFYEGTFHNNVIDGNGTCSEMMDLFI